MDPNEDYDDALDDEENEIGVEKTPEDFEDELEVEKVYYILPSLRELFYIRGVNGVLYKKGNKILLYTKENHSLDEFYDRYSGPKPIDTMTEDIGKLTKGESKC